MLRMVDQNVIILKTKLHTYSREDGGEENFCSCDGLWFGSNNIHCM